jgi:hypothetical protein
VCVFALPLCVNETYTYGQRDQFWDTRTQFALGENHFKRGGGNFPRSPHGRGFEFGRALRIFRELIHGFRSLHFVGPCVTVFGPARFPSTHLYYSLTRDLGAAIAQAKFAVMTGGGPGLMEAANRGAKDANGISIGCNIVLPKEQEPNQLPR